MYRYQIRTPEQTTVESIVDDLACSVWQAMAPLLRQPVSDSDRDRFKEKIHYFMILHVKAYDLCGLSNVCTDPASAWLPESNAKPAYSDRIYHLQLPHDVETFLDLFVREALEDVRPLFSPDQKQPIYSAIRSAARELFSSCLYDNPLCGAADLCAVSKEVGAWDQKPTKK